MSSGQSPMNFGSLNTLKPINPLLRKENNVLEAEGRGPAAPSFWPYLSLKASTAGGFLLRGFSLRLADL